MRIRIEKGVVRGKSYCRWSIGDLQSGGTFGNPNEYSVLVGADLDGVEMIGENITKIVYGDFAKEFPFSKSIDMSSDSAKGKLMERRRMICAWIEMVDYTEVIQYEI